MNTRGILLDTNAVIAWIRQEADFAARVVRFQTPSLSVFTLGELHFGILRSSERERNRAAIDSVRRSSQIILPGESTGEYYARVRYELRRKGRPIPENDIWIAATALEHDLPLMTRDVHFKEVVDLEVVDW